MGDEADRVNDDSEPGEAEASGEDEKARPAKSRARPAKSRAKPPRRKPRPKRDFDVVGRRLQPGSANDDELRVLAALAEADRVVEIAALAERCWPKKGCRGDAEDGGKVSAYRRVANAARRLVAKAVIRRPEPGRYEVTGKGRTFLAEAKKAAKREARAEAAE